MKSTFFCYLRCLLACLALASVIGCGKKGGGDPKIPNGGQALHQEPPFPPDPAPAPEPAAPEPQPAPEPAAPPAAPEPGASVTLVPTVVAYDAQGGTIVLNDGFALSMMVGQTAVVLVPLGVEGDQLEPISMGVTKATRGGTRVLLFSPPAGAKVGDTFMVSFRFNGGVVSGTVIITDPDAPTPPAPVGQPSAV